MRYFALALLLIASVAHADDRYAPPFTPMWAAPQLRAVPEVGPPGSPVRITGSKFHHYVEVFFGDQPMRILERGERYLIAEIPWHVFGEDFIYVVDSTGRARTYAPFAVRRRW